MVLACTTKEGTSAQALAAGEIHLEVLKVCHLASPRRRSYDDVSPQSQETEERERLKTAKDTHDTFKKAGLPKSATALDADDPTRPLSSPRKTSTKPSTPSRARTSSPAPR